MGQSHRSSPWKAGATAGGLGAETAFAVVVVGAGMLGLACWCGTVLQRLESGHAYPMLS